MNTFRLQLRFLIPLLLTLGLAAYLALPLMDRLTLRWFSRDLTLRGVLVTNALSDSIDEALKDPGGGRLQTLFNRALKDERLVAIGLCSPEGQLLRRTDNYPATLDCKTAQGTVGEPSPIVRIAGGPVHVGVHEVTGDSGRVANLVLLQDLSFIERRSQDTRQYLVIMIAVLGAAIALIMVVVAQLSWRGWVSGARALLRGEGLFRPIPQSGELAPLAADLRQRLRDLEDEYRRSLGPDAGWNPERLRSLLRTQLRGDEVIVVSNREPYIHDERPERQRRRAPPGERPGHRARAGDARLLRHLDRARQRHRRPRRGRRARPHAGAARAGRVHAAPGLAHARRRSRATTTASPTRGSGRSATSPTCGRCSARATGRRYRAVNQRFADAVVAEARSDDPIVLVQDYHFALLPAMVRAKLPAATILTFWHIPWPNPESFGICPWRREILEGMLGSTILGFHTRFHCNNFLETADRYLEARIEYEHSTISFKESETYIENYPISIEWPRPEVEARWPTIEECRSRVAERLGSARRASVWPSASTASTTPRASSSGSTRSSGCSRSTRNGSASSPSCRSPRRRAVRSRSTGRSRSASSGPASASTSASDHPATTP